MFNKCKHEWKVLSETVTKSKFESTLAAIGGDAANSRIPHQMCQADRKHIQVFTCPKCGELKRFVEDI